MGLVLLAARIGLAAVFATAGFSKLADLTGSRRAVADFGVPRRLAWLLGTLLPLTELAAAAALVPDRSARWGALASLALLLAFSAAIVLNLSRGRAPECRCFGQVHSAPVSWRAVARNLGLAALAVWVVAAGAGAGLGALAAGSVAGAIVLGSLLLVRRATGRREAAGLHGSPEGLPVGVEAPEFGLAALDGRSVTLAALRARGRSVLLVFSDPHCGPCSALAPRLVGWQQNLAGELAVWVVASGDSEENRAKADEHGLGDVLVDPGRKVADAYGALATPSAVLVGGDGRVASRLAVGADAIERLVTGGREAPAPSVLEPRSAMTRLELLARAGSAAAALVLLGTRDALAGAIPIEVRCKYVRCGDRCCPKKAVCRTRGGKKVCICPGGREACGAKCCPDTFVCRKTARGKRFCACPAGTRLCRGRCVALTDPAHCGGCGRECPPATVCVNGQCVGGDGSGTGPGGAPPCECPPGKTCCSGACVDLNTDEAHCGRCDQPCAPGQTCCAGECKDLRRDPDNCDGCGKRCPSGQVCTNGRCDEKCPQGLKRCGRKCCAPGEICKDGACIADDGCLGACTDRGFGEKCCDGSCVPTKTDSQNCGGCGLVCTSPTPALASCGCANGECYTVGFPGAQPCVASRPPTRSERRRRRPVLGARRRWRG